MLLMLSINREQSLLNEKYRPLDLSSFLGYESLKISIKNHIDKKDIPNLLLYGNAGAGKTTLAKIIVNELECEHLYINSSDENGVDTVRDKIKAFASKASFSPLKIIILDEADFISLNGQSALRNIIETHSRTTRFILTCNFINKIIDPIQSRCNVIKLNVPDKSTVYNHLKWICNQENIGFSVKDLSNIVHKYYPDLRKMINAIQLNTVDGELLFSKDLNINSSYLISIIKELTKSKPNIYTIRAIIIESNINDFELAYKTLYEKSDEFLPNKKGDVAILTNEYQYKSTFRIDQEICFMAYIYNLIKLK